LITVLREGIEAVVFVGGVSLGEPATSIPLAAIVGIVCGVFVGYIICAFASRTSESPSPHLLTTPEPEAHGIALTVFIIVMTNLILLIGAGLFSRSIGNLQEYQFNKLSVFLLSFLIEHRRC
jgi:high-affinity iron transporter